MPKSPKKSQPENRKGEIMRMRLVNELHKLGHSDNTTRLVTIVADLEKKREVRNMVSKGETTKNIRKTLYSLTTESEVSKLEFGYRAVGALTRSEMCTANGDIRCEFYGCTRRSQLKSLEEPRTYDLRDDSDDE